MKRIVMPDTFVYVTPDNTVAAWVRVKWLDDDGNWHPLIDKDVFLALTGPHQRMRCWPLWMQNHGFVTGTDTKIIDPCQDPRRPFPRLLSQK
jgi:hypothetical protein